MYDLLTRTISQGLQAFLPIAFGLAWFLRAGRADAALGFGLGFVAAVPATIVAAFWFQETSHQSLWEAELAMVALLPALWFARRVWQDAPREKFSRLLIAAFVALIITRQTMEIAAALGAAFGMRGSEPLLTVVGGAGVSFVVSASWLWIGSRLPAAAFDRATRVFAMLCVGQLALYAFHESAEAGLLPWSDILHAATEPYGPDGVYGRYVSAALFLVPIASAAAMLSNGRTRLTSLAGGATVAVAVLIVAGIEVMTIVSGRAGARPEPLPGSGSPSEVAALDAAPHVLFRHTAADQRYSRLSIAPFEPVGATSRVAASLACDRVAYAAGRGICLVADRGLFRPTIYKAVFFDRALEATRTITLAGSPSRTRISPDGRVGAITVFASGSAHTYKGAAFSTTTTLLDLTTGDALGDLEQFTTWRNGDRFAAVDFNFWGVTFARDSNIFYATLRTGGTTYLVRGDVRLRRLTVLHENVECPALSPDNRSIAYKKRIGSVEEPWRFYVLDLVTMTERPIAAETRSIDDQLEWLDDAHVLYAAPRSGGGSRLDIWVAPLDNQQPARVFLADADSPVVVR